MKGHPLVEKARIYAQSKHEGQIRKFENKPYFIHPERVAHILYQFKVSKNINGLIAAAYLHDVVEDTNTSIEEIKELFGDLVASIVLELTSDKNEIKRFSKKEYLANKMLNMSNYALTLKLADRIDNVNRIQWSPEKFKLKYAEETDYIINKLKEKRKLTAAQGRMIKEIELHLNKILAKDDIDYLTFDSYYKRGMSESIQ